MSSAAVAIFHAVFILCGKCKAVCSGTGVEGLGATSSIVLVVGTLSILYFGGLYWVNYLEKLTYYGRQLALRFCLIVHACSHQEAGGMVNSGSAFLAD